jgi:hypothetical protein
VNRITGLAVQGRWLFVTYRSTDVDPYGLAVYQLGAANRDGSGAVLVGETTSPLPLTSPWVVGDVLYAASNLGTATWDLGPLWRDGTMPLPSGGIVNLEPSVGGTGFPTLMLDGPFGYLVGGTYRAFDLR